MLGLRRRRRWSAGGEGAEEAGEGAGLEGVGPAAVGGDDGGAEFDRPGQAESAFGG